MAELDGTVVGRNLPIEEISYLPLVFGGPIFVELLGEASVEGGRVIVGVKDEQVVDIATNNKCFFAF